MGYSLSLNQEPKGRPLERDPHVCQVKVSVKTALKRSRPSTRGAALEVLIVLVIGAVIASAWNGWRNPFGGAREEHHQGVSDGNRSGKRGTEGFEPVVTGSSKRQTNNVR